MAVVTDWLGYRRVSSVSGRDETLISPDQQAVSVPLTAIERGGLPGEVRIAEVEGTDESGG